MSTEIRIPAGEPIIVMTRTYRAPRALVWEAFTRPEHVREWWGGEGVANPVCEMDVRPGGRWTQVMRFPNGHELRLDFVFVEVDPPRRLVWRAAAPAAGGPPTAVTTVTFEDSGDERTRYTMVARFASLADREAARGLGFTAPIEASNDALTRYLAARERS